MIGRDIEKEFAALRDGVNSGLIDDELSRLVERTRREAGAMGRKEILDEDMLAMAAGGACLETKKTDTVLKCD